jgi:hypothetical protein
LTQLLNRLGFPGQIWLVSFLDFDPGFFDREEGRVGPAPNPFVPEKVLTMSPESSVNDVSGMDRLLVARREGLEALASLAESSPHPSRL